jgi:hypothetical protein
MHVDVPPKSLQHTGVAPEHVVPPHTTSGGPWTTHIPPPESGAPSLPPASGPLSVGEPASNGEPASVGESADGPSSVPGDDSALASLAAGSVDEGPHASTERKNKQRPGQRSASRWKVMDHSMYLPHGASRVTPSGDAAYGNRRRASP